MKHASPEPSPPLSTPLSSPNTGILLKKIVLAWSQETGLTPKLRVAIHGNVYCLHKSPLLNKSGYFKKQLADSPNDIVLPTNFPGGPEAFEKAVLFSYGFPLPFDPFSIADIRCAAEFLAMTEDHVAGNLCERSDLYLNQVVLQSWTDTLTVLQRCRSLCPLAEELLMVSRCIESLAFMACMEILDPERRRDQPIFTLQALARRPWTSESAKALTGRDLWIKDLIALPFEFFRRIVGSLRRQGMKEMHVSPMIVFYANKWVLSKRTLQYWRNLAEQNGPDDGDQKVSVILQGVIELLRLGDDASKLIPVGFYFALLSRSLDLDMKDDYILKLQTQIASQLHFSRLEEFLFPQDARKPLSSSKELAAMERILSIYLSTNKDDAHLDSTLAKGTSAVSEMWDRYLFQICEDPEMTGQRFVKLINLIPLADRENHDHLYKAMNNFFLKHPDLSSEEQTSVCKFLNCQKLSQEVCIEAVQNELMPMRLIVQALFAQQMNTHQAFKECSESFRFTLCSEFSGSFSSSRWPFLKNLPPETSAYEHFAEEVPTSGAPLGFLMKRHPTVREYDLTKTDYESASFRIQTLEQELKALKKNLHMMDTSDAKEPGCATSERQNRHKVEQAGASKTNPFGRAGSCIGSMSWASQRRCATKLLKVIGKMTMFRRTLSRVKSGPTGSTTCRSHPLNELYDC